MPAKPLNRIFPCGQPGQPACPPVTAITTADILAAYNALSEEEIQSAKDELAADTVEDEKAE
jgi:hypothetical protein